MDDAAPMRAPGLRALRPRAVVALVASVALIVVIAARALGWLAPPPSLDVALGLVLAWTALRALDLDRAATAIVVSAFALYALYLGYTGAGERNYDVAAHLMYVRYVAEHLALPAKAACNICHHPPAYYVAAAVLYRALVLAHASEPALGMQILALLLVATFVSCAALILKRTLPEGAARLVATALVAFWPYTIIDAARVGNDALLYAIAGGTMLALVVWRPGRDAPLWLAAALVVLGFFTKTNALVLAVLFYLACGAAILAAPRRWARARALSPAMSFVVLGALAQTLVRHAESRGGSIVYRLLGNAEDQSKWSLAPRTVRTYLWFDAREFFQSPYHEVTMWGANNGSPFWNQLLKSSLFGTRRSVLGVFVTKEPIAIARALAALLIVLLAFLVAGQLLSLRSATRARKVALVATLVFVAASVGFHLLVPFGFHADFRFIHPVLVPLAWLYADGAIRLGQRARALGAASLGAAVIFVATSIAYFMPITWREPPTRTPTTIGDLTHVPPPEPPSTAPPRLPLPRLLFR